MTRKLLPFEYDLIATLGVTKEEYLEFLAVQAEYNDIKIGTELDIRNTGGEVALVLTVIGVLFQVGAALLMPKPQMPEMASAEGQTQTKEQRFAPRFGFNAVQELAKIGDTIPIVYTDKTINANGGVRIAAAMIWSAIRSFGQNQYLQMLTMLTGGAITAIDADKSAFGQTPITNLIAQNKWIYFKSNGTGFLSFANETSGQANSTTDPVFYGNSTDNPYRIQADNSATRQDGFSQVYSPTSSNTFGGYSPVPFAVFWYLRDSQGNKFGEPLDVYLQSGGFDYAANGFSRPLTASSVLGVIPVGATITVWVRDTIEPALTGFGLEFYRAKADTRRTVATQFDDAALFKLGSALFRITSTSGDSTDNGNFFAYLTCLEAGRAPSIAYNQEEVPTNTTAFYYQKALVRVEEARYTSLSKCNVLDFALKGQVFKRISGRLRQFGYPANDNGYQQRTCMFLVHYRVDNGAWNLVNGIFVVRRAAEQDNYIYLKFISSIPRNWEVRFEPVNDPLAEMYKHGTLTTTGGLFNYLYLENTGSSFSTTINTNIQIVFTGFSKQVPLSDPFPPLNKAPSSTNEWDWFNLDGDTDVTASFDRGPELSIVAVTEQQLQTFDTTRLYNNLSLLGFNVFSGKGLQDMRSLTAFVTQGKPVRRLNTGTLTYPATPDGPSNYAPDIFLDTIIDTTDGIGNYANVQGIDTQQLAITKRFCVQNNLFMDGAIADRSNWRSFWVNNAPFSLLEFARIGGKETLVPAVPYNTATGEINRTVQITALFNQGNIIEGSYKEEYMDYDANVEDMIATVVYRSLDAQGVFAVNRSVSVQRADTVEATAVLQNFDLSAYVTNEAQAILFGKLMCNIRRYVRSSIEFKTFPTTSPVMPGAYIYMDLGQNQWDGIYTGVVAPNGVLNTPVAGNVPDGTYNVLLYRSSSGVISTTATITGNVAASLSAYDGWLFVLGQSVRSKRVFRVSQVDMDEEGEVTVRATIYPCDANDRSLIADFTDNLFTVRR